MLAFSKAAYFSSTFSSLVLISVVDVEIESQVLLTVMFTKHDTDNKMSLVNKEKAMGHGIKE